MKLVTLKQLISLPQGTVFMKHQPDSLPCFSNLLAVKTTDSSSDLADTDFVYHYLLQDLVASPNSDVYFKQSEKLSSGDEVTLNTRETCRWGMYDEKEKFIVLSTSEIRLLIAELASSLCAIETNHDYDETIYPVVSISTTDMEKINWPDVDPGAVFDEFGKSFVKLV